MGRRPVVAAVSAIDRYLRKKLDIIEFSDDPDCLYRIRFCSAYRDLSLPDTVVRQGEPVAEIHLWNEHLPPMGEAGLGLEWGVRMRRMAMRTHQLMAEQLLHNPVWADVRAVGATTAMFPAVAGSHRERTLARFGYIVIAHQNPEGAAAEFWQRVWAWALWHTYQSGTRRVPLPFEISRSDIWMSAEELQRRYGAADVSTVDD